jgi:SAM-dependent methyltransferase
MSDDYERLLRDPWRERFASEQSFFIRQKCRVLEEELARRRPSGGRLRVLDAGCGHGTAFQFLRGAHTVIGSDVSLPMLQVAKREGPVAVQEALAFPFADGAFDAAFAFCVYHHIDVWDRVRHLRELRRVVRPGGVVAVFEHNPFNPVTRVIFRRATVDRGCQMIYPSVLRRMFVDAGLVDVSVGYLLFMPERVAAVIGFVEDALRWLPLGGQYFLSATVPGRL